MSILNIDFRSEHIKQLRICEDNVGTISIEKLIFMYSK